MPGSGAAELDAAGVTDPALRAAYATCRALNAAHGRTYFLATRLLPAARRPAVHALYGFARYADEIVDDLGDDRPVAEKAAELDALTADLEAALDGAPAAHPVLAALADTARRYDIDRRHFADFMVSMRMDTTVTEYATFDDLAVYVHGSAAVIGLQMLPILGTRGAAGGGRAACRRARGGVPAHELPARRRGGPRPRPRLPASRRARGVRRRPRAAGLVPAHPAARSAGAPRAGPPRRPHPRHLPARAAGDRDAGAGVARLRGLRVHPLPGHPRRDREGRLRRAAPPRSRCRTGGARPSRCPA